MALVGFVILLVLGHPLLAAAVCGLAWLVLALLYALGLFDDQFTREFSYERQKRSGAVIMLGGVGMLAVGGILLLAWPGTLAETLLAFGPGLALSGGWMFSHSRSELARRQPASGPER
ncbi:hypothetical protein [Ruania alba]|uniref:hypothetical protein n=1 Tax=Ruania alba TaxID=648782 RepID=UPI000B7DE9FC|nr:hypothetical protein [Ruania alba]